MLVGQPPFRGDSVVAVAQAILHDEPPALGGSPGVVGLDRIVHRALRKPVGERYQTADAFAQDLRSTLLGTDTADVSRVRPMSRLVVLPFRMLRPDPSIDFLAFSLADAISSALSGLPSLVVRSTAAASRFAADSPDIRALARKRWTSTSSCWARCSSSGDQVRVSAQLARGAVGDAGPRDDRAVAERRDLPAAGLAGQVDRGIVVAVVDGRRPGPHQP